VDKYILAAGPLDKSVALGGVKPFHNTLFSHYWFSYSIPGFAWTFFLPPSGPPVKNSDDLRDGKTSAIVSRVLLIRKGKRAQNTPKYAVPASKGPTWGVAP
jgi:hypothetical protein